MKIKITKTVDDTQIPAEVRRMLDQCKNRLLYTLPDQMSSVVRASLSVEAAEFFSAIDMLTSFRQELASIDESLAEAQNVLVGYRDVLMPSEEKSEQHDEEWMLKDEDLEEDFDEEG